MSRQEIVPDKATALRIAEAVIDARFGEALILNNFLPYKMRLNEQLMKTHQPDSNPDADMLPEYDFSGKKGARGKYHQAYSQGHTVRIIQNDGTVTTQYFTLEDGAVLLSPDVRKYFPDSESVNQALRGLINLIPQRS